MLINDAWAQTGSAPGGGEMFQMVIIVGMFLVLYLIMIRPQMKRAKEHKAMIESLQKGDEVVTSGGVLGKVVRLNESYVTLQIADNVQVQIQRPAVQLVLPKGTIKSIE